jgi:dihydropteroate synthase
VAFIGSMECFVMAPRASIITGMTKLVGILNITPDSFSDGGLFADPTTAIRHAEKLFADGAALVDVGAESTRPNATQLTPDEEWARLEPVLPELLRSFPGKISLDTYHPETIARAAALGPLIANDVTGMNNPAMIAVVAKYRLPCVVSHLPGMDIQAAHHHADVNRAEDVVRDLLSRAKLLEQKGIDRAHIILDPGIGFGKTMELNWHLLRFAELVPNYPVMIGYSRKRFLGENRMEPAPNLAAGKIAIASGAAYLRVHDVAAHAVLVGVERDA